MNADELEKILNSEPQKILDLLSEEECDSTMLKSFYARALVKLSKFITAKNFIAVQSELVTNKQLFNLYLRCLKELNDWETISSLEKTILRKSKHNIPVLLKALYKTEKYSTFIDIFKNYDIEYSKDIRFLRFCAFVKLRDYESAVNEIENVGGDENINLFRWHNLDRDDLLFIADEPTGWATCEIARSYFKEGKHKEVISLLTPLAGKDFQSRRINNFLYRYLAESILTTNSKSKAVERLRELITKTKAIPTLSNFNKLYGAHLVYLEEGLDKSVGLFHTVDIDDEYCFSSDRGSASVLGSSDFVPDTKSDRSPTITYDSENSEPADNIDLITMTTCDSRYFYLCAEAFLTTFEHFNPGKICHIHIVNPDKETYKLCRTFRNRYSRIPINYSYSFIDDFVNIRPYYASVRFMISPVISQLYGKRLLVTDIDVGFVGSIDQMIPGSALNKLTGPSLKIRSDNGLFPWRQVSANTFIWSYDSHCINFTEAFTTAFWNLVDSSNDKYLWWIDQALLTSIVSAADHKSLDIKYNNLYEIFDVSLIAFPKPGEGKLRFVERIIG